MQWPVGAATRELAQQGLLTNLDDLAAAGNWAKNLPPIILKNVIVDGHFVSAPVDIHGANWMFYSTKVFKALNLQPPKTWDEFFAQAPQIKAASYIPLALGANAQQDANIKALDRCAQQGQKIMAEGPAQQLLHFPLSFMPDVLGQINDVLAQYWSHPDMSAADATKQFAAIVGSAGH